MTQAAKSFNLNFSIGPDSHGSSQGIRWCATRSPPHGRPLWEASPLGDRTAETLRLVGHAESSVSDRGARHAGAALGKFE